MHEAAHNTRWDLPLVSALRRYLQRHPQAADSLEGIRQWWLPAAMRTIPPQRLRLALEEMIAAGEVSRRALPDGGDLYACAPQAPKADSG